MELTIDKRTIGDYELTDEANNLIDAITAGMNVKGFAFAGAGKSTLLRGVEKYHVGKKGLYICYNKSLEREARKLFKGHSVDISTGHAFALNSFPKEIKSAFLKKVQVRLSSKDVHTYTSMSSEDNIYTDLDLSKNWRILIDIAEQYISTASTELKEFHLPKKANDLIGKQIKAKKLTAKHKPALFSYLVKRATELTNSMLNPKSECPTTHDGYVKYWQLSNPKIKYDYIMFDEAQDANPVLLSVILKQKCQQIFVGDKYQSIYQFRGGVNAMDVIPHQSFPLSCSFRYGQEIADLATKILQKADPKIKITGLGYDTKIVKGSEYNDDCSMLFISHSNVTLLETLIEAYHAQVPTVLMSGKAGLYLDKLNSMIEFKEHGTPTYKPHQKYNDYKRLVFSERDSESTTFAKMIDENIDNAKELRQALSWSLGVVPEKAELTLVTAHMSKGLEYDTVMLSDDFSATIAAFKNGKPLDEPELNLLYVAITRAKKTLIIPDELYAALEENLAFTLNKHKPAKCLLDNLLPEKVETGKVAQKTTETAPVKPQSKKTGLVAPKKASSDSKLTGAPTKAILKTQTVIKHKIETTVVGDCIAIEIGRCKETDKPNFWKPTDTNEYLNPNLAILGTMGTGKTQTVKSMLKQLKGQEDLNTDGESLGMLIFDYKDDYVDDEFVNATNATVLEPSNIPINPFSLFGNNRLAPINTAKVFVSTLTKVFRLGNKQEQMLQMCVMAAYENKGISKKDTESFSNTPPTLRDVYAIFNSQDKIPQDSLNKALYDLHEFEVFEPNGYKCKNLYDTLEGNVVVVRLGGIDSSLQNLIVAVLLDAFYIQMHNSGKPKPKRNYRALKKLILVDEADNFMSQDFPSLRKILKEGREFGVGCALSTQGLDHFKTKENEYSQYIPGWICHRLEKPKAKDVEQLLSTKSKKELEERMNQVSQLEKHHSLFVNGKKEICYQESTAFWKIMEDERKG
ncbi:DUF87 domain-containing protein [Vibrio sp. 10N.222.54.A1]|uniref:helicase HerA domain-containing protein n=1 Tax=unclassified Vibrio TaxID=2614977 RepID=UPI00354F36E1